MFVVKIHCRLRLGCIYCLCYPNNFCLEASANRKVFCIRALAAGWFVIGSSILSM